MQKTFFVIFFLCSTCYAQSINSITVSGNKNFSYEDYVRWSGISAGVKFFPQIKDSVQMKIIRNLSDNGYYHSSIHSSYELSADGHNVNLFIKVDEGQAVYLKNIFFNGAPGTDSLFINDIFDFVPGEILTNHLLVEGIESILDYYEEHGSPFAKVTISSISVYRDPLEKKYYADVNLNINTGGINKIDKVEIQGNTNTKDYVILRDARINRGMFYSQNQIEGISEKLNRLRFFEPVETPSYYINSKNEGILLINVKEKQTNNFDGIIGYVPGRDNEKGYITGLVNISLRNLLGTGRAAAIKWQQIDRYSQEMELKYLEPWLFNLPFNINAGLFQLKQDTSYVQRKIEGSIEFLATEDISASLLFSSEAVIPTESDYSTFSVYNSSILSSGFNLKIDTRDDFYSPTTGILFFNSYTYSRKKINGPEKYLTSGLERNISLQRFTIDLWIFKQIFKRQVLAAGLHGREIKSSLLEVSDLYRFGGTNTLRGYRENQFFANRLLWSNLEYRLLLTNRSYGLLFFDSGYYLRNEDMEKNIPRSSAIKIGYGLGLNIETGLGVLVVSYALAKGETFSEGKIHFGIINEF